jgi:hypothetical protein
MEDNIADIIHLIEESGLDQTIKDILIRDLKSEGLTDFLREQIKAYCLENLKRLDAQIEAAKKALDNKITENPA